LSQLFASEDTIPQKDTKQLFQTIENMTQVKGNLKETENNEEEESDQQANGENDQTKVNTEAQFTELEATLNIAQVSENIIIISYQESICL